MVFNSGIALTLDLSGYSITNTKTDRDETLAQYADSSAIVIGDQIRKNYDGRTEDYDKTEKGNHLTIVNSDTIKEGSITGAFNGVYIFGPKAKLTDAEINDSEHAQYSKLIVGTENGSDKIKITGTSGCGINGNANPAPYADITINTSAGTIEGARAGIYNPQAGKLTINNGTIKGLDDTDGTGIEIRGGELEVNGGTITTGNNADKLAFHKSNWGSTTTGAGIAVAPYEYAPVNVNIKGGTIKGYAALSVANPNNVSNYGVTVEVTSGTLESTSTATKDDAKSSNTATDLSGSISTLYELIGKNAIVNNDDRVNISVSKATIKGALATTMVGRTSTDESGNVTNGYTLGEGNTYTNFSGDSDELFAYYYATTDDAQVIDVAILGTEGWNKSAIENNWDYVVAPTGTESVGTALTQLIADSVSGAFSLTSGANKTASIVSFDANNNLFKDLTYTSGDETKYYTVIDAGSANDLTSFNITGNERITSIAGGAGNDSLKPAGDVPTVTLTGGAGNDLFFFDGNKNTITDFGKGNDSVTLANSKFRPANADFLAEKGKITIDFGGGDALMFENLDDKTEVSLPGGHVFATRYHAFDKQITFTSVQSADYDASEKDYATIDAASASAISIMGNSQDNRIIGSNKGGSLNGGAGNDRLLVTDRESKAEYLFEYKAGNDSIEGFDDTRDTLDVDATKITEAKGSGSKLTLTIDKTNSVVLKSDVDIEKVSLNASGDYLTSSGYRTTNGETKEFKLFANAKGKIDLTDTPYKDTGIEVIDATDAKKQSVTLTADSNVTTVKLAENKKKDLFEYGGGSVTISGYEAGIDRLNIADIGAVSLFTVDGKNGVSINAGGKNSLSLQGALADQEILIRDGGKNNSYQKFVFHDDGVLYNKGKKPTEADIYSNVDTNTTVTAADSIKKIFLQTGVSGAKIESGNNKATLDASEADGVTLIGGAKNNKFIASTGADMFVYKGGKDNIQDFDAKDKITLDGDFSLSSAKISASGKSLKFKFTNKNVLTLKSDGKITSASINGGDYSFSKNAVGLNGVVSLTSQFSGSYNLEKSTASGNIVYGGDVRKNITFKGTNAAESLVGGQKKTTFKGGGGDDTLKGGDGKDIFFYAKTDSGNKTIENFDFGSNNDKIKIASGTIKTISKSGDDIIFSTNGGSLTLTKDAEDTKNVLIKANNTYYWFADTTTAGKTDGVSVGDLITADTRVSNAQATAAVESGYEILDLSYTTNLVKTNLATKAGEFEFTSSGINKNDT